MRIAIVAGESGRFAVHTGLANVVRDLGRALANDSRVKKVCIVLPYFGAVDENFERHGDLRGPVAKVGTSFVWSAALDNGTLPVWLIDSGLALRRMRNRQGGDRIVWTDECGERGRFRHADMAAAMLEFNRAAADWLRVSSPHRPWLPTVVHCVNWEASLIPRLIRDWDTKRPRTVLSVDLLTLQGIVSKNDLKKIVQNRLQPRDRTDDGALNFMAEGIRSADVLHLPNPHWATQILMPRFSHGLAPLLERHRVKIMTAPYALNPDSYRWDEALKSRGAPPEIRTANYVQQLAWCRADLRKALALHDLKGPIFLVGNRLAEDDQKNYRAVAIVMRRILKRDAQAQLVLRLFPPPDEQHPKVSRMWAKLEALEHDFPGRAIVNPTHPYKRRPVESWLFLLLGADVALMPSHFEPAGLNHLQALSCGCPVIGTNKGGIPQAVRHGVNGWLFDDPQDHAEFTRLCQQAVDLYGSKKWKQMVAAAMRSPLTWQDVLPQYLKLYRVQSKAETSRRGNPQA